MDISEESFIKSAAIHILAGTGKLPVDKKDVSAAVDAAFQLNDEVNKRIKLASKG